MKPGQYTQPSITVVNPMNKQLMGFRIVKLLAKEPAGQRELSDPRVQQAIRSELRDRREQLLKAAYYEVLRNEAKVENYYAQKVIDSNGAVHVRPLVHDRQHVSGIHPITFTGYHLREGSLLG